MGTPRTTFAAALTVLVILGGCGSDSPSSAPSKSAAAPTATTVATTTTTLKPPGAIKAALLTPTDVRGAKVAAPLPDSEDDELSACFPGNPIGARGDPNEVMGPDLELTQGRIDRTYGSVASQATPEQAASYVATIISPAGSACLLDLFKRAITAEARADPNPVPLDASGMTATSSAVAVADGGASFTINGLVKGAGKPFRLSVEAVTFRKGGVVVVVDVGAIGGTTVPGQALELARKVAGRLP